MTKKALISQKLLSDSWIIDFRVSHHITSDWSFFVKFQKYSTDICLVNDKSIRVTEYSKAEIFVNRKRLTLSDVLYVSELNRNLLLIEAVSSHSITVKFWDKIAVFRYNKSVIATAIWFSSVYILKSSNRKVTFKVQIYQKLINDHTASVTAEEALFMSDISLKCVRAVSECVRAVSEHERASLNDSEVSKSDFSAQAQTDYQKWHWRFSHADAYQMKRLMSCVEGINCDLYLTEAEKACSVCLHSKMIWVQNKSSISQMTKHLERVYSDIWRPYWEVSLSENRYFVSFSDEFSWYSEIFLLEARTDIYRTFKTWKLKAEKETDEKLQIFQSDSAEEYRKLTHDWIFRGIEFKFTTPYTSEQNSFSEHLNCMIMKFLQSMLYDAQLSTEF